MQNQLTHEESQILQTTSTAPINADVNGGAQRWLLTRSFQARQFGKERAWGALHYCSSRGV